MPQNRKANLYLLFSVFYFVQGAIQSYYSNFQKPYLLESGVSLDKIALISSVMLAPFWIKSIFGYVSDRFPLMGDHRKSYMILGLLVASICYLGLSQVSPGQNLGLFFALVMISTTGMALFDTCADGMAVNITPQNEEGAVQSAMMFGRGVGYIVLSVILGRLAVWYGYSSVFLILSGIVLIVLFFVIWKTPRVTAQVDVFRFPHWREWGKIYSRSGLFVWLSIYSVIYSIASFGIDGVTTLLGKMKLGFTDDVLGNMGSFQGTGSIAGALLAAFAVRKLGIRTSAFAGAFAISLGGFLLIQMFNPASAYALSFIWGIFWAFQETLILVLCMKGANGRLAATLFALLMMFSNVGTSLGEWIATQLIDKIGLSPAFMWLSGANLLLIPFLALFFRKHKLGQF